MTTLTAPSQPLGPKVSTTPAPYPPHTPLTGRFVTLVPLQPSHADGLFATTCQPEHAALWTYLPYGPFPDLASFREHITSQSQSTDSVFYAINLPSTPRAIGIVALISIRPCHRTLEIGHVLFSPLLQRTPAATELHYLLAKHVFDDLGYRRYEWRCNDLNEGSKRAAGRLGFTWEGCQRGVWIVKGRSRDTAWFSVLEGEEWERVRRGLEGWLAEGNLDAEGRQGRGLREIREGLEEVRDGRGGA